MDRADELSGRALRITSVPALLQRVIFIVFMFNTSLHRTGALARVMIFYNSSLCSLSPLRGLPPPAPAERVIVRTLNL